MGSNKQTNKQIDDVARKYGIDRKDFKEYIHRAKNSANKGGADNYSWKELENMARQFKNK